MEINITILAEMDCFNLSHSAHDGGPNAGQNTWQNSLDHATENVLLDTEEKLEAMRAFVKSSGGWSLEEISEFSDQELNALFLQWIAGDCREFGADCIADIDWTEVEEGQSSGRMPSNMFKGIDGQIYFYL